MVKHVDLPEQLICVIAHQAEAERERRAKVIHAEGAYLTAEKLAMAAELIRKQAAANSASLSADFARNRLRKEHDGRFPVAH